MSSDTPPQLSDLLEHHAFLERFARGLTRDAGTADDVVQETWLVALERPPQHRANLRGWLRRVALSVFRARRSRTVAPLLDEIGTERTETPDVSVERETVMRALGAELLALPEPYRRVLILRYYEDKTPTEIATELGRPLNTVTSQLGRGLKLMRERLDRSQSGGRSGWLHALWLGLEAERPLQRSARADRSIAPALRSVRVLAWLGVAGTAVVSVVLLRTAFERAPEVAPAEPLVVERDALPEAPPLVAVREALPIAPGASSIAPETPNTGPEGTASKGARLLVDVLTTDDRPVPGANVLLARHVSVPGNEDMNHFEGENPTDASGRVEIPVTEVNRVRLDMSNVPQLGVTVQAIGYVDSDQYGLPFPQSGETSLTIRLEPNAALVSGRVTDSGGAPIEGAFVEMGRAHQEWIDLGEGRSRAVGHHFRRTDPDGSFAYEGLPSGTLIAWVQAQGFVPHVGSISASASSTSVYDVVLQRGATIAGRVETADGLALEGARVRAEFASEGPPQVIQEGFTDVHGRFELQGILPGPVSLVAQHPTLVDHVAVQELRVGEDGAPALTLVLKDTPPLRLLVQREDGSPLGGVPVAAYPRQIDEDWEHYAVTDEDGRATFEGLPSDDVIVSVYQTNADVNQGIPPCYVQTGLQLGLDEHTLTVTSDRLQRGVLRGTLLDNEGHPFPEAQLWLRATGARFFHRILAESSSGAFRKELLPAQTYELIAECRYKGTWVVGSVEVLPEGTDLGEIVLPELLAWRPPWPDSRAPSADAYELVKIDRLTDMEKVWLINEGVAPPPPSFSLLPGRYEWRLSGGGKTLLNEQIELR